MNDIRRMRLSFCVFIILMGLSVFIFHPIGEGISLMCTIIATPFLFTFAFYFFKIKIKSFYIIVKDMLDKFR
ncbi:Uncharacterised protein [Streptococcus pneumoniae]|nr:Uncharacterised protein [Streptococcus pneumoniae]CWK40373.1 Uncharacterised protein [Streptococcus pneumoniae]